MARPLSVSIVTPCYNGAPFLAQTLQSAMRQTRPPLEVIVVDDGSTDESAAIAAGFGPPVRVIRQENRGESAARNRALADARGTHVLFLDADDLLAPEALERLAAAIADHPGAVGLMSCAWFTDDPGTTHLVKEAEAREFYPHIIGANIAPPHCWLTPIEIVREAGGFCETMRWFEDWDLWWRVGLQNPPIVPVPYHGALYRQHANSQLATTRAADRARGHTELVGRLAAALLDRPELLEQHGTRLFWSLWSSLVHARQAGVPWASLGAVTSALVALARRGPRTLTSSRSARIFRVFGVRAGFALQRRLSTAQALGLPTQTG
jgi:hypothetical protein